MIDMEMIRRLNNYDVESLISVLNLNEDHLYHRLTLNSPEPMSDGVLGLLVLKYSR